MPYTSPAAQSSGNVAPVSWATAVKAATDYLANPPACRVYHNTTQSIAHATLTKLAFNTERFDTDTMHDTVTNNTRITISTAGLYLVGFTFEMAGAADYSMVYGDVFLNNTSALVAARSSGSANSNWGVAASTIWKFAASDYIELRAFQQNGAVAARNAVVTSNSSPEFFATWIGLG